MRQDPALPGHLTRQSSAAFQQSFTRIVLIWQFMQVCVCFSALHSLPCLCVAVLNEIEKKKKKNPHMCLDVRRIFSL